ncbi:uncharacterized protein LOC106638462 [Copidosoma floridanum]|uniref:uncharacterized protein LOC106638462 n=1 Tax=Copidosoma floridanum TaxID=29053 RepID=UPI0006C96F7C|nr:uncharacterized protein LOC106638462 [Copidosoma floridanum]
MKTTIINQKLTEQIHYLNLMNSIEELKLKIERLQLDEPDVTNMKARMYDLQVCSDEIDMRYKEYITYSKSQSLYDKSTLENYYTEVMNENNGIPKLLFKIHEQVVGLGYGSLLNIIDRYIEYIDPYCEKTKSRQRYFYDLFLSIMSYETKGFLVLEYAYALKRELKNKTMVQEFKDVHRLYHERANATFLAFKEIMSRSEQIMWKCDPIKHTKNKSYAELRNVFRRVFYDAQEFHSNFSPFHCDSLQCPTITKKKRVQPVCQGNNCFFQQRHCSNIVRCRQLLKNEAYDVCVLKNQDHGRRYSYVNKETSEIFAGHPKCDGQFRTVYKVIQSYPGSIVDTECNVCDCICDESENSDRYISLRPVTSDVHNNYVVTGVRFQVVNHTLYIKIQEGELLPFGFIHGSSTRWKDIEAATDVEDYLDEIGINLLQKTRKQKRNLYPTYQTEWSKFLKYGGYSIKLPKW